MNHAVGCSTRADSTQAVSEALDQALAGLGAAPVTLALLLVTHQHRDAFPRILAEIHRRASPAGLVGCTGDGLISGAREIEDEPALTLWLASWPGGRVRTFRLEFEPVEGADEGGRFTGWHEPMPEVSEKPTFLLFPEPFTSPAHLLLEWLNREYPGSAAFGGVASGGFGPGQNRVFVDEEIHDSGIAGAIVTGVRVETIVSQGCRPIGKPFVITKSEKNVLLGLGGKPAYEQLVGLFESLETHDRELMQRALHVGQVVDERRETFARGDLIVRNVMGVDRESGAVAITEVIRPGRTIQFMVRDAESAKEDLRALLKARRDRGALPPGAGAILCSCNGRGSRMFGSPDQDSSAVAETFAGTPLAGFFAGGEIGPVGGRNFLHGFTASLALFVPE
ncbi:MAG: FIST C-terminal domain-containing protein [Planctomycetales bacterium]|nr:FIST C-terminal domain-containing protein [Planctomycetales bacterium]